MMIIKDKNNLRSFIVVTREDVSSSLLYSYHFISFPGSIFVNAFSGRLRPEQYRDPLCAFIVLACKLQGHGKRYAQNHADRTKQASPKNQREKDNQRGQSKPLPHEPRFNHIVEYEVNGHISRGCHYGAAYP